MGDDEEWQDDYEPPKRRRMTKEKAMLGDWAEDDEDDLYSHFVTPGDRQSKSSRSQRSEGSSSQSFMFVSSGIHDLASSKREETSSSMEIDPPASTAPKASKKKNPIAESKPLGSWERHTKGIGSKLLQKMGWKGKGLGKNENGIIQPLQAVARAGDSGLDENDFMGIDRSVYRPNEVVPEPQKEEIVEKTDYWKKDAPAPVITPRAPKIVYKTLQEIQQDAAASANKPTIIDMRPPNQTPQMDVSQPFISQFAPELRHNVTHLVDLRVSSIHSIIKKRHHAEQQTKQFKSEEATIKHALEHQKTDISFLTTLKSRLAQLKEGSLDEAFDYFNFFKDLKEDFPLDYNKYRLDSLIFHYVFPKLDRQFLSWQPLYQPEKGLDEVKRWKSLLDVSDATDFDAPHSMDWNSPVYDDGYGLSDRLRREQGKAVKVSGQQLDTYKRMVYEVILPKLRMALNGWDVQDPDAAMNLLALWKPCLNHIAYEWLLYNVILHRLKEAIKDWQADNGMERQESGRKVNLPLDTWVTPWIALMGASKVPDLLDEIRRKLQHLIVTAQSSENGDQRKRQLMPAQEGVALIRPWKAILDASNWALLVARGVMKRIEGSLKQIEIDPSGQDLGDWHEAITWTGLNNQGTGSQSNGHLDEEALISADAFGMALYESGFWHKWFSILGQWLHQSGEVDLEQVQQWYVGWKQIIPKKIGSSTFIQSQFKHALQLMLGASTDKLVPMSQFVPVKVDFSAPKAQEKEKKPEVKKPASQHPVWQEPTIKELLEETAEDVGVLFISTGRKYEGNQIFKFGKVQVYLDRDLVYALQDHAWAPISINALVEQAQ